MIPSVVNLGSCYITNDLSSTLFVLKLIKTESLCLTRQTTVKTKYSQTIRRLAFTKHLFAVFVRMVWRICLTTEVVSLANHYKLSFYVSSLTAIESHNSDLLTFRRPRGNRPKLRKFASVRFALKILRRMTKYAIYPVAIFITQNASTIGSFGKFGQSKLCLMYFRSFTCPSCMEPVEMGLQASMDQQ